MEMGTEFFEKVHVPEAILNPFQEVFYEKQGRFYRPGTDRRLHC